MSSKPLRIYLSPPHVGEAERSALLAAFDSGWIAPVGPEVDAFEHDVSEYVGPGFHAAALSSGTAALHLGLILLGVRPGDDVLVSSLTFAASANAVRYLGAQPVFVDSSAATWTIDPDLVAEAISSRRRAGRRVAALMAVDLYGQCADYDRLTEICSEAGVPILEDAAEALGASHRGRPAGTLGELGVFSFNGNKIITTSGGGMLVGRNREMVARAKHLATQARDPAPHYQHSTVGYNYRLSNLLAALGRAQLSQLDERVASKRRVFGAYQERLGGMRGLQFMPEAEYGRSTRWLTCALIDESEFGASSSELREHLEAEQIEARPIWKPMHLQPVFLECPVFGGDVSKRLFRTGICLPSGTALSEQDLDRVIGSVSCVHAGGRP